MHHPGAFHAFRQGLLGPVRDINPAWIPVDGVHPLAPLAGSSPNMPVEIADDQEDIPKAPKTSSTGMRLPSEDEDDVPPDGHIPAVLGVLRRGMNHGGMREKDVVGKGKSPERKDSKEAEDYGKDGGEEGDGEKGEKDDGEKGEKDDGEKDGGSDGEIRVHRPDKAAEKKGAEKGDGKQAAGKKAGGKMAQGNKRGNDDEYDTAPSGKRKR
jgi:hypothetical protein